MKKFILGYLVGGVLGCIATDYLVRTDIFMKLTSKGGCYK